MADLRQGTCRSCNAPILWVTMTETGKPMPLNPQPKRSLVVLEGEEQHGRAVTAYVSHFATCSAAAAHRKAR